MSQAEKELETIKISDAFNLNLTKLISELPPEVRDYDLMQRVELLKSKILYSLLKEVM